MPGLRLYDYRASCNCLKVRILLGQLGLEYERVNVDIFDGDTLTDDFRAINPARSTPVLETADGRHIQESNAILWYLAEGTEYLPGDAYERAQVLRWLMFEQRYVQTSISRLRYWTLTGKLDRFAHDVASARALGNRALDVLDGEFAKRPFIAGDAYTIADMSIFAYSHVAGDANFDLSARKSLCAWFDRIKRQPGFAAEVVPYSADPYSSQMLPFAV